MKNYRINYETEKTIVSAKFKMPVMFVVLFSIVQIVNFILLILGIVFLALGLRHRNFEYSGSYHSSGYRSDFLSGQGSAIIMLIVSLIGIILLTIIFILISYAIKKSTCSVTNKRIFGIRNFIIFKKYYSYRFDKIDNIQMNSLLGINTLLLNFTQGNISQPRIGFFKVLNNSLRFKILFIHNREELYDKLTKTLTTVKTELDAKLDIELEKVRYFKKSSGDKEEFDLDGNDGFSSLYSVDYNNTINQNNSSNLNQSNNFNNAYSNENYNYQNNLNNINSNYSNNFSNFNDTNNNYNNQNLDSQNNLNNNQITDYQNSNDSSSLNNPYEELKVLQELLNSNAITKEEFEERKATILRNCNMY